MTTVVGLDGGNRNIKIFGERGAIKFSSLLGEWRERTLISDSTDDMEYEFEGEKGFAGSLAEMEAEFPTSIMGDTKAHNQLKLRVMLGLHRYFIAGCACNIVVGQPISKHNDREKGKIKKLLTGQHTIKVNGVVKTFDIQGVAVAAEGGSAFWSDPRDGLVHILDLGGGTLNAATLIDGRYNDKASFTLPLGTETTKTKDINKMAKLIHSESIKHRWKADETILLVGGMAEELREPISEHFHFTEVIQPKVGEKVYHPVFANAIGFYTIGREVF